MTDTENADKYQRNGNGYLKNGQKRYTANSAIRDYEPNNETTEGDDR